MGEAQGKKVDPAAVAVQAIEAQPPFGQIKPWRGHVDSVRPTASSGEDVANIKRAAQEAWLFRRRKEDTGVQKGRHRITETDDVRIADHGVSSVEDIAAGQSKRCGGSQSVEVTLDDRASIRGPI